MFDFSLGPHAIRPSKSMTYMNAFIIKNNKKIGLMSNKIITVDTNIIFRHGGDEHIECLLSDELINNNIELENKSIKSILNKTLKLNLINTNNHTVFINKNSILCEAICVHNKFNKIRTISDVAESKKKLFINSAIPTISHTQQSQIEEINKKNKKEISKPIKGKVIKSKTEKLINNPIVNTNLPSLKHSMAIPTNQGVEENVSTPKKSIKKIIRKKSETKAKPEPVVVEEAKPEPLVVEEAKPVKKTVKKIRKKKVLE